VSLVDFKVVCEWPKGLSHSASTTNSEGKLVFVRQPSKGRAGLSTKKPQTPPQPPNAPNGPKIT